MVGILSDPNIEIMMRLALAGALGAILGFEREVHGTAAGLRTHILVTVGSALFMVMSIELADWVESPQRLKEHFAGRAPTGLGDPGRIAAQVVSGIGFIGGGAILKDGFTIRGLTTAATLWMAAAVGMTVGAGQYLLATFVVSVTTLCLLFFKQFNSFVTSDEYRQLRISVPLNVDPELLIKVVNREGISVLSCDIERVYESKLQKIKMSVRVSAAGKIDKFGSYIMSDLEKSTENIAAIKWSKS